MWTRENRGFRERERACYPSGLSDAEWALTTPPISPAKHGRRHHEADVREELSGVLYVLETGCR